MAAKSDGAAVSLSAEAGSRSAAAPQANPLPPPHLHHSHYRSALFSLSDCCWLLCSLLVLLTDAAAALCLCADYLLRRDHWWCALTLLFVAAPSAVVQVLSFRWFLYDFSESCATTTAARGGAAAFADFSTTENVHQGADTGSRARCCRRACTWMFQVIVHILQLGQVWRYLHTLYLGAQSRWQGGHDGSHFYLRMLFESADVSMLQLLEGFLKSAPQLVLQLSIMVHSQQVLPLQGLCASASLLSLAWTLTSYQKVLRDCRDDKEPMSYKAVVVQVLWHVFSIGARATAFALFASVFQLYFGIFVVAHWCLMTFWIIQGETDFCMSKWEEIVYNMMVGIIYVFCWFKVREGQARCRLLAYCFVVLVENVALTALWYLHHGPRTTDSWALVVLCAVTSSQALGTFFMLVYYCLLHPDSDGRWGCIGKGVNEPCEAVTLPALFPDVVSSPPRTLQRTMVAEHVDRDGVLPVFQVRPTMPLPQEEGPVIRIDLPRKKYPAWDVHFIDRRLRKTILALESTSPITPRLQYRSESTPKELTEYETTV
ncbi:XK-related protein 7-like [Arapaima gigas]